jgi:tetratricopeptide (TPR) repeat protein
MQGAIPDTLQVEWLTALFFTADFKRFESELADASEKVQSISKIVLMEKFLSSLKHPNENHANIDFLEDFTSIYHYSEQNLISARIALAQAKVNDDLESYKAILKILESKRLDRYSDHIGYWILLAKNSRVQELSECYQENKCVPCTAEEAFFMPRILRSIGLKAEAYHSEELAMENFWFSIPIWLQNAEALIKDEDWQNLRTVSFKMLSHPNGGEFKIWGKYWQGLSLLRTGKETASRRILLNLIEDVDTNPEITVFIAGKIRDLGMFDICQQILLAAEVHLKGNNQYWTSVYLSAMSTRDLALMLRSSRQAYLMDPNNKMNRASYALALISARERPFKSLEIMQSIISDGRPTPNNWINLANAQIQNGLIAEASESLKKFSFDQVPRGAEQTAYHHAMLELAYAEKNGESILEHLGGIDNAHLFPEGVERLNAIVTATVRK